MIDKSLSQYQQDKKKVKKLKKSVKKLNKKAPKGEFLAYINSEEAELLKRHGGSGIMTKYGVPSFIDFGDWDDVAAAASSGGSSPSSSNDSGSEEYQHEMSYSPPPAPTIEEPSWTGEEDSSYTGVTPVDYASLDNEEKEAVDRGEPTAQMTPTERNEQGYGPGGKDNPDYKRKQYEITGDIDELADFRGIDTRPKVDIADIHGETDDPSSVSYDPTYIPAAQAAATRKAIAEYSPSFFDSGIGKGLKTVAKIIAQPFLPEPVQRAITATNLARTGAKFAKAVTGKDIKQIPSNQALINKVVQNLTNQKEPIDQRFRTYVQRKQTPEQRDSDNLAQAVSSKQDVVSKAIAQYTLQDQRKEFENRRSIIQNILDQGTYQGKELTNQQKNELINYIAKIDKYLVETGRMMSAAYGGRVDKALTGGSKDI